ncbi:MAG: asparaginase [Actinomycetota bacterium]
MSGRDGIAAAARPVTVLGAGGTIAIRGEHATPGLDAAGLVAAVPQLAACTGLEAVSIRNLPGAALGLDDALAVARAAVTAAAGGRGVVVTTGTDTLEELAVLIDLMHAGDAPIVVTGAIRPATAAGADGPANLLQSVALAGAPAATGLGTVVLFGGQVHAARYVRKTDSTGPAAFASPQTGPVGYVEEERVAILTRPPRRADALDVARLDARVPVVGTGLGDDGALLRLAVQAGCDGVVVVALGAGHLAPPVIDAVERAARRVPVVAACRPERGALLTATYGFRGCERDLRAAGAIPAGRLSPAAARITLAAALGAGRSGGSLARVFADADP